MSSTLAKKAAVISAVEQLVELGDCQSITITRQDTSGAYSVALVTQSSDIYVMTLKLSSEGQITSATPLRIVR